MTDVIVRHTVADFDTWKAGYDAHEGARRQHGCRQARVLRGLDDANVVTVLLQFDSPEGAQGFLSDASLKAAMANAGVVGAPDIALGDVVETVGVAV